MKANDRQPIHWFPGHMARASRELREMRRMIDVILEVADARLPSASRNPIFLKDFPGKPHLLLLSRADLADPVATDAWLQDLRRRGVRALACNLLKKSDLLSLREALQAIHRPLLDAAKQRGRRTRPLRVVVVGVPNTGKSTLINQLAGRRSRDVAATPGVTRSLHWLRAGSDLALLDTPGILPTRIRDQEDGLALAAAGLIDDASYSLEHVAFYLFKFLITAYPDLIQARYGVALEPSADKTDELRVSGDADPAVDPPSRRDGAEVAVTRCFDDAALRAGCYFSNRAPDLNRFARMLLSDFRSGRLGRITLERAMPAEPEMAQP